MWNKARNDYCQVNGMRLCTINELRKGHAQGTGCKFDGEEVWSSSPCGTDGSGRWTFNFKERSQTCRAQNDKVSIRCCADFAPPERSCPFAESMDNECPPLMVEDDGSCKTSTIARCVQCSGCDYYKVDEANEQATRSYLRINPHCANCRNLGKRTAIRSRDDFGARGVWKCLQSLEVPAQCLDFAKCDQLHYDTEERRKCTKFYGTQYF